MKNLLLPEFLNMIKKHGATGVLAIWLFYTHLEVQDVKHRLYDCLDKNKAKVTNTELEPIEENKKDTIAQNIEYEIFDAP